MEKMCFARAKKHFFLTIVVSRVNFKPVENFKSPSSISQASLRKILVTKTKTVLLQTLTYILMLNYCNESTILKT